ncbi:MULTISPECIES: glutathione S-transferase [Glaesserella]|uniref:Glutathione S-transferase n=1 Tax=Glaesserella australis TaxID=2094024 RepID=A0A328C0R1_9PAST|nr:MULTISPECIES: glutathione S-transferase [Glaesserella]AUI67045.1 glutathione S-transferase [Glaesserella sp. 15-184]RAL18862.1 glutathione S-transferase [Glaesserella australis]
MKLWYSTTSSFARKTVATLKYHQLEDRVEMLRITNSFDPDSPHNQDNPLGRIPALQMEDGEWLFGSFLISQYLDGIGTQPTLFPTNEKQWKVLSLHSLVEGILENTTPTIVTERRFRPENEWWKVRHEQLMNRNIRSFKQLEEKLAEFGDELNIGTLTAVCLIDWWQFRPDNTGYDLAKNFPNLTAWTAMMNEKYPALKATQPSL